ncbi:Transposase IS116/IS110/IS902 family protein [Rhizobiales bacterium GAS191]|nr:Transposase IS116/IS110/IS902 family protein [Rhizobiales bacterium GAS191]
MTDDIEWYVGFDWASETHCACLMDRAGRVVGKREVAHAGADLAELCDWLIRKTGAEPGRIGVAIETPHGPVVETFLERGFAVFAINPKQLDRFRDRFTVAGAKDDSRDAQVLGDSLRTDSRAFRRLVIDDPVRIELREWSRIEDELKRERTRLANRVRDQLWRYYPQMLQLSEDLAEDWLLALWRRVPTPAKAAKASEATIQRILKAHRIRRIEAPEVVRILRQTPLTVAAGASEAASAHIRSLAERIGLINQQLKTAERKLEQLLTRLEQAAQDQAGQDQAGQMSEQRDVTILRSMPGIGRTNLATLLAEGSEPLGRRDYHVLRTLSGVAPVTRRSGKAWMVLRRLACNRRLRNALYHWARVATQHDPVSRQRYAALRGRGHSHGRALRSVGDRLLYVACTLLRRQVLFDPDHNSLEAAA